MDPTYSSQGFDDTYSRTPRSRAGSGVSTTEGLLQSLQLAETSSFETGSYTSSRPTSSRGLASPAYLSPSLSHSPGYLATPLSQHQQPFPPLSSEAIISDAEWFEAESSRVQGTPLLRLEPAHDQLGAAPSSPPLASVETDAMRYSPRRVAGGLLSPPSQPANFATALSPSRTTLRSAWAVDHPSPGRVRTSDSVSASLLLSGSDANEIQ